jgi:hypothetical protein
MAQLRQRWNNNGEAAWLSMLVETLEQLSDPDERAVPCDSGDVSAAKAHLAHPAYFDSLYGSHFSLRN